MRRLSSLRVLHVGKFYPPHMGGMEIHLQTLCRELRKSLEVSILVANDGTRNIEECQDGIQISRAGVWLNLAGASICPSMTRKIREARADLVHMHLPNPPAVLAYLGSGHRGPLVATWHLDVVRQQGLARLFRPFEQLFLARCSALIASSPNYVESSPTLSAYRERCSVIPYGIPVEDFDQCDQAISTQIRARYGPRIVLGVGRLVYYKGFEYLVRAMAGVDAKLLLVGDGPLRGKLEEEARCAGAADKVVFLGEVSNERVAPYYHAADIFVLPSTARSEAFGIVQLEAMACGTPVINTKVDSGVPFASLDGQTGLTVPPADSGGLCKAINTLLTDSTLRARFARAAVQRVRQEFTVERMAKRTLDLYSTVAHAVPASTTTSVSVKANSALTA